MKIAFRFLVFVVGIALIVIALTGCGDAVVDNVCAVVDAATSYSDGIGDIKILYADGHKIGSATAQEIVNCFNGGK